MDPRKFEPIDVAQHFPFIAGHLHRPPRAVIRALWLVAEGLVETDGEPCPVRARGLDAGNTAGEAGRTSVVLAELEERGVVVRYRGRGRRPHLWSLRPRLEHWRGVAWSSPPGDVAAAIGSCSCRAVLDFVARFPGQGVADLRRVAKFELLSRDHLSPPGLFPVETRDKIKDRAGQDRGHLGFSLWKRGDNGAAGGASSFPPGNSENSLLGEEENARFDRLKTYLEHHAAKSGQIVYPGSVPEGRLIRIARELDDGALAGLLRHFDRTAGDVQIPSGSAMLEQMARSYTPRVAAVQ